MINLGKIPSGLRFRLEQLCKEKDVKMVGHSYVHVFSELLSKELNEEEKDLLKDVAKELDIPTHDEDIHNVPLDLDKEEFNTEELKRKAKGGEDEEETLWLIKIDGEVLTEVMAKNDWEAETKGVDYFKGEVVVEDTGEK